VSVRGDGGSGGEDDRRIRASARALIGCSEQTLREALACAHALGESGKRGPKAYLATLPHHRLVHHAKRPVPDDVLIVEDPLERVTGLATT
jgi:hypothetical protein